MYNFLNIFKHILPRSKAWLITIDKSLRQFFDGLGLGFQDIVDFIDLMWLDMFPETTRQLTQWEQQFGIVPSYQLSDTERRERLTGLWNATGGQSPRYIQDVLQASGFNVYVYDWWESEPPPVARNPYTALGSYPYGAGDPEMQAGEPLAQAGNGAVSNGYWLVNKIYTARKDLTCLAGEDHMQAGEPLAQAGENEGLVFERVQYSTPTDPAKWPYLIYVGGSPFGTVASIPIDRWEEFEDLLLKICPGHLWIGVLASQLIYLVDDVSVEILTDDVVTTELLIDG